MTPGGRIVPVLSAVLLGIGGGVAVAHDGPPFPIVSSQTAGPYVVSVWTDPDTTDDGTAAGQFWVMLEAARGVKTVPPGTEATVSVQPLDLHGPTRAAKAAPVANDAGRQFIALLLDHEGRFAVNVKIEGPLGRGDVQSQVDATYDQRPPPGLVVIYLLPFVAIGALWVRVLLTRRSGK